MVFLNAFKKLHKNMALIIYPIVFDLFALAAGLLMIGFNGEKEISIRMILETGIPSASHLSNNPLFINTMEFLNVKGGYPGFAPIIVITTVIVGAFLQGGYISYLAAIVNEKSYNISQFAKDGKRNWIQFILLEVIVFLIKIAITAFLVIFFGIVGVFASLVFMIVLRIIFIYLEFSIVVDRTGIIPALKKGRHYLVASLFSSLFLIVIMYTISSGLSFILHYFWSKTLVIVMIFVYAYVMSGVQIALMQNLYKAKRGNKMIRKL